jgi:putative endonuclease
MIMGADEAARARRSRTTTETGRRSEDLAVLHLVREGYVVLGRNVRTKGGELDIVATDGELLCFVEVRRRAQTADALRSIDARKRARLVRAAAAYLRDELPPGRAAPRCRFDVVVVHRTAAAERVELVRGAFEAEQAP